MKRLLQLSLGIILLAAMSVKGQTTFNITQDTLWTYTIHKYPCELALVDNTSVFIGADDAPVCCLNKQTGVLQWKLNVTMNDYINGFIHTFCQDAKGTTLFFHGAEKDLFAVDKANGNISWKYPLIFDDDLFSKLTRSGDTLFINPASAVFMALTTQGQVAWKTNLKGYCTAYTITNNHIYCQLSDGSLCALNKRDGKFIRSIFKGTGKRTYRHAPFVSGNLMAYGNGRDSLVCMDLKNNKPLWQLHSILRTATDNGNLYAYDDSSFSRLDPLTGKTLWHISGGFAWLLMPTEHQGMIYIQTRNRFYIVNNETGQVEYASAFPYKSYTKPIIENGIMYLGGTNIYMAVKDPSAKK